MPKKKRKRRVSYVVTLRRTADQEAEVIVEESSPIKAIEVADAMRDGVIWRTIMAAQMVSKVRLLNPPKKKRKRK